MVSGNTVYSQQMNSSINVSIHNIDDFGQHPPANQVYPLVVEVEQTIKLKNFPHDTLLLFLEKGDYNSMFKSIFFQDFIVVVKDKKKYKPVSFSFDDKRLTIFLNKKKCNVKINYYFQSDFGFNCESNTAIYFLPFISKWHSWYFTNSDIEVNNVKFSIPDNQYFFCNKPVEQNLTDYKLATNINNDISFYLYNKAYYETTSFTDNNINVNLFLTNEIRIDTIKKEVCGREKDSIIVSPHKRVSTDLILKSKTNVYKALNSLVSIFKGSYPDEINIIDAALILYGDEEGENFAWGSTTEMNDNQYFVLIDTSFWNNNSLTHELIHIFNNIEPEKGDSSYYFFNESMVEYLSVILMHDDSTKIEEVFNKKYDYFNNQELKGKYCKSIFNISENVTSLGDVSGTSTTIYHKTPYLIYRLSIQVGLQKFMFLLQELYSYAYVKNSISFEDFEFIMKTNGVTQIQWDAFLEDL